MIMYNCIVYNCINYIFDPERDNIDNNNIKMKDR